LDTLAIRPDLCHFDAIAHGEVDAVRRGDDRRDGVGVPCLDYTDGGGISTFEPLNEQGLLDTREQAGCDVVAFATSDCGDPVYLRPGPSEPDTVYITYHDSGQTGVFAESVAVLIETLKRANRDI
jgi:hypothetical protein